MKKVAKIKLKKAEEHSDNSDFSPTKFFKYINTTGIKNPLKLLDFIRWEALDAEFQNIKTQKEFANKIGVSQDTLTDWKKLEYF